MKFLISILIVSSIGFFFNYQNTDLKEDCNCSSSYCSCTASCVHTTATCSCGLTCSCTCGDIEEGGHMMMPTASNPQNNNSIAAQAYFKALETPLGETIAGYFEILRDAIKQENLTVYTENAALLETAFSNLSKSEKAAYYNWVSENLTTIED